jgi:hypothetical protein
LPEPEQVPARTFITVPADLADSVQLAAMPIRDTAGLPPPEESASTDMLAVAIDALAQLDPAPTTLTRLSIYDGYISVTFPDPENANRSISASYREGEPLYLSEPRFDESVPYDIVSVDPAVPDRLKRAIEQRFPQVRVTDLDLDRGLSHEFDLVWYVSVDDARGQLATVYADLDGAIVAVDQW